MTDTMRAETVEIAGNGGDAIEAYLAQPLDGAATGGVVVIHHMPGYDDSTKEITRKFAARGYLAICPQLSATAREAASHFWPRAA
jgi:carboxymethylenebutenolidase